MSVREVLAHVARKLRRQHGPVKSFEQEVQAAGGISGEHDVGARIVPVEKIVGSVGRWQNLRSDFFYRKGGITQRFVRIGEAMRRGTNLPPIDVYKLKRPGRQGASPPSEYYVVDGHHRVAMARKLGQDFLDAHVREIRTRDRRALPESGSQAIEDAEAPETRPDGLVDRPGDASPK